MKSVTDQAICDYIRLIQPGWGGVLEEIQQEAEEKQVPIIPHEVARFLSVVMAIKRPKEVLEIGTAVAFSAGLMSRYLAPGGHITTIDRYEVMLKDARQNILRLGLSDTIQLIEDDAANVLPKLTGPYDLVFLDAAKGQYAQFLPEILRLLPIGGILIADDVLQNGDIVRSRFAVPRRQRTIHKRMRNFLWDISHLSCLTSSIVPVGDGGVVCVKTGEYEPKKGEFDDDWEG